MELVNLAYKVFLFDPMPPDNKPFEMPIRDVVMIEKTANGMQEILTNKKGEVFTVQLRGLRMTMTKQAEPDVVDADFQVKESSGDANVQS